MLAAVTSGLPAGTLQDGSIGAAAAASTASGCLGSCIAAAVLLDAILCRSSMQTKISLHAGQHDAAGRAVN